MRRLETVGREKRAEITSSIGIVGGGGGLSRRLVEAKDDG